MTRKSKREIEKELNDLKGSGLSDIEVSSSVTTITDDMTDGNGNLIDEKAPEPTTPDDYQLGEELETQSPVVTVYELE